MRAIKIISGILLALFIFLNYLFYSYDMEKFNEYFVNESIEKNPNGILQVTFFGTSTLLFDDGKTQIMIDSFFTRPSLLTVATTKIETDKKLIDTIIKDYKINRLKAIFISHSHYDHSFDLAYLANQTGARVYGSETTLNIARGGIVKGEKLFLYNTNKIIQEGNFSIKIIKSIHSRPGFYNNDLGQTIDSPISQPQKAGNYKEGGSFEFLLTYKNKKILVRPSFNFIKDSLNNIKADVVFLGITGLGKAENEFREEFYREVITKTQPKLIIPIHWDNFFLPLNKPLKSIYRFADNTPKGLEYLIDKSKENNFELKLMHGKSSILLF